MGACYAGESASGLESSRSERVRGLLRERYPNHLVPSGHLARLAREVVVSRQLVRAQALRGGYIVVEKVPQTPGMAQVIRDTLRARFPDRRVPRGALQALATELGVTRQHVRQVAVAEGYSSVKGGSPPSVAEDPVRPPDA